MSKNLKIWLGIIAISLSSAVIGGVATGLYIRTQVINAFEKGPRGVRSLAVRVLRKKLNLSKQQAKEIRPIVKKTQRKFFEMRQRNRPEIEVILGQAFAEIEPKLDQNQRAEFNKLRGRILNRLSQKVN